MWNENPIPDFRQTAPEIVAIVGSRALADRFSVWAWMGSNIDPLLHVVVTGDARGADSHAHEYCKAKGSGGTEDTIKFGKSLGKEIIYPLGGPSEQLDIMDLKW